MLRGGGRRLGVLAFVAPLLMLTQSARADEVSPWSAPTDPTPAAHDAPARERRWYGYETLTADAASLALVGLGAAADQSTTSSVFVATGLISYALAAPVVHLAHGHVGKAFGDLGVRACAPLALGVAGGFIGMSATSDEGWDRLAGVVIGIVVGTVAGTAAASVIDATLIANEDVPRAEARGRSARATPVTFAPTAGPTRNGATVGLTGTF